MRKGTDKIRDENKEENRNIQLVYEKGDGFFLSDSGRLTYSHTHIHTGAASE